MMTIKILVVHHSHHSIHSHHFPKNNSVRSSGDWKDFESRQDSMDYNMYEDDDVEEESDDSDKRANNTYNENMMISPDAIYTNYASRRLPQISEVSEQDKGKQPSFQ